MANIMDMRDFDQDISIAKWLADKGPVVITDRGKPAYVLLTHDAYTKLAGTAPSILDLLDHPESAGIEFEPERLKGGSIRSSGIE